MKIYIYIFDGPFNLSISSFASVLFIILYNLLILNSVFEFLIVFIKDWNPRFSFAVTMASPTYDIGYSNNYVNALRLVDMVDRFFFKVSGIGIICSTWLQPRLFPSSQFYYHKFNIIFLCHILNIIFLLLTLQY